MYSITTSNVTVMVTNVDRAIEFYKAIGLELKQRWNNYFAQVAAPGVIIGLHPAGIGNNASTNVPIGVGVENLEDVRMRLKELNVKFTESADKAGDFIGFQDPDGTPLYFMQSKIGEW
ncbi:MAG TPA: VOC family protein [Chitinophagaceae bacterium]|nr:VOC family protein [Chitinophagaceae bacterium]